MLGMRGGLGVSTNGGGGGSTPPVVIPAWDLVLLGENISYSAGLATSWANDLGGPIVLTSNIVGAEPVQGGKTLNGFPSPLFPTRGALMNFDGTVKAGSFTSATFSFLYTPDWDVGAGDRAYVFEYGNNTPSADQHIACGIANIPGWLRYGLAYASTWNAVTDMPVARTCLITMVLQSDGSLSVYRDRALLGNAPGVIPSPAHTATYLGVGASTPNVVNPNAAFRGSLHWMAHVWGTEFTADEVAANFDLQHAKYQWSQSEWNAENVLGAGSVCQQQRKRGPGSATWFGAANLSAWETLSNDTQTGWAQGTVAFKPSEGSRWNALPSIAYDGVDDYMAGNAISGYIGSAGYEYLIPFMMSACSSSVAPATAAAAPYNQLVQIFADIAGFVWTGCNVNGGFVDIYPGHWGPGVQNAPLLGQYVLGTRTLLHVRYDSTLAGGTLTARLGAGPLTTTIGVPPPTSLINATGLGIGLLTNVPRFQGEFVQTWTFKQVLSTTQSNNARAAIGARYNIPV